MRPKVAFSRFVEPWDDGLLTYLRCPFYKVPRLGMILAKRLSQQLPGRAA